MTPLDVAQDDQLWARYLRWLSHFCVARDRTQALLAPSKWNALEAATPADDPIAHLIPAPSELSLEQRMVVLGWTWPDRDFTDPDVFTNEICTAPKGSRAGAALAQDMSLVVGLELVVRMSRVADVTGHNYARVYQHVTTSRLGTFAWDVERVGLRPAIGIDHLELLTAGQVPVDLQTLIEVSEALHLAFGPKGWRIEKPQALAIKIRRSHVIKELIMLIHQVPLADAEKTLVETRLRVSPGATEDDEAAIDPETFNKLQMKPPVINGSRGPDTAYRSAPPEDNPMRALYARLEKDSGPTVELRTADIDQWVRGAAKAPGVKPDARRKGKDGGLPNDAFESPSWWTNGYSRGRTQVRAWQAAGFRVLPPKLVGGRIEGVMFVERQGRSEWHRARRQIRSNEYRRPSADALDLSVTAPDMLLRLGWQTRAALLPGALAGKDLREAWVELLNRIIHTNPRLMTDPPPTRRR